MLISALEIPKHIAGMFSPVTLNDIGLKAVRSRRTVESDCQLFQTIGRFNSSAMGVAGMVSSP